MYLCMNEVMYIVCIYLHVKLHNTALSVTLEFNSLSQKRNNVSYTESNVCHIKK